MITINGVHMTFDQHQNFTIINSRWPDIAKKLINNALNRPHQLLHAQDETLIIDGIQLTGAYDRVYEAEVQANHIKESDKHVFIYGTALGDLQSQLVKRSSIEQIHVIILNMDVFALSIHYFDQQHWLSHPKTNLYTMDQIKDVYSPYCIAPAELMLMNVADYQLRDRLIIEKNHDFIEKKHSISNAAFAENLAQLAPLLAHDLGVEELLKEMDHQAFKTTLVIGAGPGLELIEKQLVSIMSGINPPKIITVDVCLPIFTKLKIKPDIVVYIDADPLNLMAEKKLDFFANTALVYFPRMKRQNLENWQGPRYKAYSKSHIYNEVRKTYPAESLFSGGSVIHPATDLAIKLGAKKIIFIGTDFGFYNDKTHAHWPADMLLPASSKLSSIRVMNNAGELIVTLQNFLQYLRELERLIEAHSEVSFINTSQKGAKISGAPYKGDSLCQLIKNC